jgi:hypothetical protein
MEVMEKQDAKLARAKKRLDELKGFYGHLAAYLLVNIGVTVMIMYIRTNEGDAFGDVWDFGSFSVWFFWGIGLFFHALHVFSVNPIFSKRWEEQQIQKFMEQDKKDAEKFM